MKRWLICTVLSLVAAYCMLGTHESWRTYQLQIKSRSNYEQRLRNLKSQEQQLKQEAQSIKAWNDLWAQVNDAKIDPEFWFVNPVDISRTMAWTDLEQLFIFLSNGNPKQTGYWFTPELMSINRVAQAALAEGNPQQPEDGPPEQTFDFRVKGKFLIPKLGVF